MNVRIQTLNDYPIREYLHGGNPYREAPMSTPAV